MNLTLYHNPVSTCSQKVRITLAEKGLPFESKVIDWLAQDHLSDWYLKINPNGVVPTLVHNDVPVMDSSVICEYLEEVFPQNSLAPSAPLERAEMRAWMRYFEEVPTTAIRIPSFNMRFKESLAALDEEVFDDMTAKMPLRKQMYREMGQKGFSDGKFDESIERLRSCLERVASTLNDGRPWLLGDNFSIADIVLIPSVVRMVDLGLAHVWDDLPVVQGWLDRVLERPSFDVAYFPGSRMKGPEGG